ncbi:transcriptional regulator [Bordetella ansorpii]|uniref:Transcriptional regulator n=1 Tax=Bordetella ansorpii TaxID=288768 RepID=A0A157M8V8_9BORD|nr:TetR family transcriptional regulator [Bordetella ansorpii]SAI05240.1 transcriptional regulator [Bordetella ansorpii]
MARPRTIDREHLLDVAQALVADAGTGALTFGALARAAGLAKASVQSVFGTREALIEAILDRWMQFDETRFAAAVAPDADKRTRIRAHVRLLGAEKAEDSRRVAALMVALASADHRAGSVVQWYRQRIDAFSVDSAEDRLLRIAFLAADGAFFVRHLANYPMNDALWNDIHRDIDALLQGELPEAGATA